ncbi:unnamed protein product [Linum tenue]|uniref:Glycosyltransferases n=1 Tax=Linum tenue TaxID=586396 RepID=A0AAV0PPA9_9ROSI|nr:unnamed protein product [Linum tenue]
MGSSERPKKKVQLWKKAAVHFALCFVMGFFTGFAPTGSKAPTTAATRSVILSNTSSAATPHSSQIASLRSTAGGGRINKSRKLIPQQQPESSSDDGQPLPTHFEEVKTEEFTGAAELSSKSKLTPRRLIIIITPTNARDPHQGVNLRRLANTLRLVPPPVLWVVVEHMESPSGKENEVSEMLRSTGMMYRHLEYRENFTAAEAEVELEHQRNLALKHLERHRLSGIVHFAGIHNVYDLDFFDELREIEMFGTWPMALLTPHKSEVVIQGPVCDSSQVIGWHLNKMKDTTTKREVIVEEEPPKIHVSGFAFNSSILWDPERWGRPSSSQRTSQNSIKFVKEAALDVEGETKLKGIPAQECSKIMVWRLRLPATATTKNVVPSSSSSDSNILSQ